MLIIVLNLHLLLNYYTKYNDTEHMEMCVCVCVYFLLPVCLKQAYVKNSLKQISLFFFLQGLPSGSVVKNSPANAGDSGLIPGLGRALGEENGNPLHYSCLGNPMDRGVWQATVHGVAKSRT